jgi:SAM-dependent methyltransferase
MILTESVRADRVIARLRESLQTPASTTRERAADLADLVLQRRDRLTPPTRLQNVGEGDFGAVGEAIVHYLQALAGLKSSDRVLDIGCGIGRTARVLARELKTPGSYDGFDIVWESISWCQKHYRHTPAPFRFKHADIHNTAYNPTGRWLAADYTFPYADESFDLVIAISVFTHLLPENAERYLTEASRVLSPGGRMFLTWFLLADAPTPASDLEFKPTDGPAAVVHYDNPEAAIAYPETWVRDRLIANQLTLADPIHFGSWRGTRSINYQDIVVVERVG